MKNLIDTKVGDIVYRYIDHPPKFFMELMVTGIDSNYIHCGSWKFSKAGGEVDEELGWTGIVTGSFICAEKL